MRYVNVIEPFYTKPRLLKAFVLAIPKRRSAGEITSSFFWYDINLRKSTSKESELNSLVGVIPTEGFSFWSDDNKNLY